jgi:hemerythrin-like domain-containing protein
MKIHDTLCVEHKEMRAVIEAIRASKSASIDAIPDLLTQLQGLVRTHFRKEEVYYKVVDQDKRYSDRGFIHQLRNDHAALLFGMESLLLRFKKNGPVEAWWEHFERLMNVFGAHMDREEKTLFPESEKLLQPDEWTAIEGDIDSLDA